MATTTQPRWAAHSGPEETAYGPTIHFTYDDGTGSITTAWTPDDGTDIHVTSPAGVGLSLSEREASSLTRALDRALAAVRGPLHPRRWRTQLAACGMAAAVLGGFMLAAWTGAGTVPRYSVTAVDQAGEARDVAVTVERDNRLRRVFNAVTDTLTDEAGYTITIACGTTQLAIGTYAKGTIGERVTGLPAGAYRFEAAPDATCSTSA